MAKRKGRKKSKSKRKTFETKASARKHKTKGQSPYKVKGGWRLSKPRKKK